MIFRRYGNNVLSVTPNFDARAMTEVGFTRDGTASQPWAEFEAGHVLRSEHALSAEAEGDVQGDVEEAVLRELEQKLRAVEAEAGPDAVLLILNEPGQDQPKTRGSQATTVVGFENRLRFQYTIDPPLRVGVFARK